MKTNVSIRSVAVMSVLFLSFELQRCAGAVVYSGGNYSETFDSLGNSGTGLSWANDSTISGWHLFDRNGVAITTYDAGTGSGTGGSFYSFGPASSTERALGGVGAGTAYFGSPASGDVAGWIVVAVQNGSGSTLGSFTISFTGEQWRNSAAAAQTMVLEYGFGTSFSTVSTWNAPGGNFDWTSPVSGGSAGAIDGNVGGQVSSRGGTIGSLSWADGDTLWIRWVERNDTGNDHGLAIDDFSFGATPVPEPGHYAFFCALGLLGICGGRIWLEARRLKQS